MDHAVPQVTLPQGNTRVSERDTQRKEDAVTQYEQHGGGTRVPRAEDGVAGHERSDGCSEQYQIPASQEGTLGG